MKIIRLVAAAAAGLALAVSVSAAASAGSIGVGVSSPVGSSNGWEVATVARGTSLTFTFKVSNPGTATSYVTMMATGAGAVSSPQRQGGDYLAVQPMSALAQETVFSPATFSLAPGAVQVVTGKITIPADAPSGLQPSAAGVKAPVNFNTAWALASTATPVNGQITSVVAAGVRMYITVP